MGINIDIHIYIDIDVYLQGSLMFLGVKASRRIEQSKSKVLKGTTN